MSKKCCGIIYKDNEKFCAMCGKLLAELPEYEEKADPIIKDNDDIQARVSDEAETDKLDNQIDVSDTKTDVEIEEKERELVKDGIENDSSDISNKDDVTENDKNDESDGQTDDDDDGETVNDKKASVGLKFIGSLMVLLLIASVVAVGLGVYFVMLNPFYKDYDTGNPVVYEGVATDTDVNNIVTRPPLINVTIDVATTQDADKSELAMVDATNTDTSADETEYEGQSEETTSEEVE